MIFLGCNCCQNYLIKGKSVVMIKTTKGVIDICCEFNVTKQCIWNMPIHKSGLGPKFVFVRH